MPGHTPKERKKAHGSHKKLTKAQIKKRSEIAEAIHEKQPGLSTEKKFKFATAQVKKSAKKTRLRKKAKA